MQSAIEVRAEPGGRVTLHFTAEGYQVQQRTTTIEWLLDDLGCATSLIVAVAFGAGAAYAYGSEHPVLASVLAVLALPGALVVLVRVLAEAVGELLGVLMIGLLVLMFPLLVFPSVRRWARGRFRTPSSKTSSPAGHTLATEIEDAEIHQYGDTVAVVLRVKGEGVRYSAVGETGEELARQFQALLEGRQRAKRSEARGQAAGG